MQSAKHRNSEIASAGRLRLFSGLDGSHAILIG